MRKIEENMIQAMRDGRARQIGNTTVHHTEGLCSVYLHGHMICQRGPLGLHVSLAGWDTVTTRSRLSAIVRAFADNGGAGLGVSSRKGVVRLHDARGETVIDATGWHRVAVAV